MKFNYFPQNWKWSSHHPYFYHHNDSLWAKSFTVLNIECKENTARWIIIVFNMTMMKLRPLPLPLPFPSLHEKRCNLLSVPPEQRLYPLQFLSKIEILSKHIERFFLSLKGSSNELYSVRWDEFIHDTFTCLERRGISIWLNGIEKNCFWDKFYPW